MSEKPTADYSLGIEHCDGQLRCALLTTKAGKPIVEKLFVAPLELKNEAPPHHDLLYAVEPQIPRDPLRKALYVTGLTTQETLIRTLDIKLTKEKDIDAVLAFQAEPVIPYSIDQAILDKVIFSSDENGSQLTLFALRKDHLQNHLDFYNELNIEPESIGCHPAALAAFSKQYAQIQEPLFVVHLGLKEITVLLVDDGKVLAGHSTTRGINGFIEAIHVHNIDPSSIDFSAIDSSSPLYGYVEALKLELGRSIYALTKQARGQEISSVLMTGEGAEIDNLAEYLCGSLKKISINPTDPSTATKDLRLFAIPIGLALGCLPESTNRLNFRKGEFVYPYPWKRVKRPLTLYITCCTLIAILLWVWGSQSNSVALNTARVQYQNLLTIAGTDHFAFEQKNYGTKPENAQPIDQLSAQEISERLSIIEQQIQSTPTIFPLKPNTPRVVDVLAWIINSPKVVSVDPKTGEKTALLQIENFYYSMIKRPDKTKPREHYQVKIEIEFSSKEPMWAREFHDMLVAPNDFVDPKGEVKWSAVQGRYRTSFFLKDRTYYP
jgi:type IV pilus assembly protein PilM